jgi:hypothetical protein
MNDARLLDLHRRFDGKRISPFRFSVGVCGLGPSLGYVLRREIKRTRRCLADRGKNRN